MTNDAKQRRIGDSVTYRDSNLRDYVGTLEALGRTPRGGDCWVQWHRPLPGRSEECLANLCARHITTGGTRYD
jgi:hypothetical protein